MLLAPTSLKVFALRGTTDMRKSFSGLAGLVETQLGEQVESGHLFLFFNRRRDRVKLLYFVGDGLVIFYKKLETESTQRFVFTEVEWFAHNLCAGVVEAG